MWGKQNYCTPSSRAKYSCCRNVLDSWLIDPLNSEGWFHFVLDSQGLKWRSRHVSQTNEANSSRSNQPKPKRTNPNETKSKERLLINPTNTKCTLFSLIHGSDTGKSRAAAFDAATIESFLLRTRCSCPWNPAPASTSKADKATRTLLDQPTTNARSQWFARCLALTCIYFCEICLEYMYTKLYSSISVE